MQATSEQWKALLAEPATGTEYQFVIAGTAYSKDNEVSHRVQSGLFETFGSGNAAVSRLDLTIFAEHIPRAARIERYVRLVNGVQVSEWLPAGVFFTNRRALDDGLWTIEAYDSMRKADAVWEPDQSLAFPLSMPDAVAELCRIMGVELDSRSALNSAYTIDYPANNDTVRNILQYIAAAHGGNWVMTGAGKLRLVPLVPSGEAHPVGLDLVDLSDNGIRRAVSRVTLRADEENSYTAGDDTGLELSADCPYATQKMVEAILDAVSGYQYQPYKAGAVRIDPAAELGDPVAVGSMMSFIASMTDDGCGFPDISAPGEQELEEEYPSAGPMTRQIERKIAETKSTIAKTAEEIGLKVEATDGRVSQLTQTVSGITFSVSQPIESGGQSYVEIALTVNGVTQKGYVRIDGNVDVSGQLSAEALYASLGDIARLTVDSLSTSRRIPLYLAGDTSDDNYLAIRDKSIRLMWGVTDGSTEQASNPDGALLYWDQDISGASIGADGYPYVNGGRVFTTTEETPWPVMVYIYTEVPRREISFNDDAERTPIDVYGIGYGAGDPDRGKGFIQKAGGSFDMWLLNSQGDRRGIFIGDDYTDIIGLRKTRSLDFSGWEAGGFTETLDGDLTEDYSVEFDSQGRPVKITDSDGHAATITW